VVLNGASRPDIVFERVLNFERMNTHEVALTKGEGRAIWLLGDLYTFKLTGEALSVTELTVFPQNGPPPHIHQREDESFWVLEGEFSVLLGERTLTAGQGAFVHIPKGMLHTYKNVGSTPGRMIVLLTPGGFERLWAELGEPATQRTTPPPVDAGVIEKLIALAPTYHLQIPPAPR
jgi:mannose-6-phosphate isomerase-like protein (cupin superfamily)